MRSTTLMGAFALAWVTAAAGCQAGDTTPAAAAVEVAGGARVEAGKQAARGYIERLINNHEWDAWDDYFGEILVFNGHEMSRDDMREMAETFATILDGFRMEIEEQIAEGDTVATRVTIHGTHTGDYMGLEASGKTLTFGGLALDRIEDGKIVESWHQMDIWGTLLMASDD